MYFVFVVALMLVCPLTSIGIQILLGGSGVLTAAVVAKWFVFWMVGVRLFLAGLRQIVQPRYTAEQDGATGTLPTLSGYIWQLTAGNVKSMAFLKVSIAVSAMNSR